MSFFGLGGFEIILVGAVALFVLGPKRLLEGIREGRRVYSDLKRQRDALQSMITEAIDLEDLKNQVDAETITRDVKAMADELTGELKTATDLNKPGGSVPRNGPLNRPPIIVDSKVRDAIPDLGLGGVADSLSAAGPVDAVGDDAEVPEDAKPGAAIEDSDSTDSVGDDVVGDSSADHTDEVKS